MTLIEQKELAVKMLDFVGTLRGVKNYALFGGAVRDWECGIPASDLDIIIEEDYDFSGAVTVEKICNHLDCAPKNVKHILSCGPNKYSDSLSYKVVGMDEFEVYGQRVQFIFVKLPDSRLEFHEAVLEGFGIGIVRGYYDKDFNKTLSGEMLVDLSNKTLTIFPENLGPLQSQRFLRHYLPKLMGKFPDHKVLIDCGEGDINDARPCEVKLDGYL